MPKQTGSFGKISANSLNADFSTFSIDKQAYMKQKSEATVEKFLQNLEHPQLETILSLRQLLLSHRPQLTEQIKWNAPSYSLNGEDCLTMRLFPAPVVQLVFHRGSAKKAMPAQRLISDDDALLQWKANDRAVAGFSSPEDLKNKEDKLRHLVNEWVKAVG